MILLETSNPVDDGALRRMSVAYPHLDLVTLRKGHPAWLINPDIYEPAAVKKTLVGFGYATARLREPPAYLSRHQWADDMDRIRRLREIAWRLTREIDGLTGHHNKNLAAATLEMLSREMDPNNNARLRRLLPPKLRTMLSARAKVYQQRAQGLLNVHRGKRK